MYLNIILRQKAIPGCWNSIKKAQREQLEQKETNFPAPSTFCPTSQAQD